MASEAAAACACRFQGCGIFRILQPDAPAVSQCSDQGRPANDRSRPDYRLWPPASLRTLADGRLCSHWNTIVRKCI